MTSFLPFRIHLPSACVALALWAGGSSAVHAQSAPIDLTELSMEELLSVRLIPRQQAPAALAPADTDRWQIAYRYHLTRFEEYYDGSDTLSISEVMQQFPVVPSRIEQQAHVIEAHYQASEALTLLALPAGAVIVAVGAWFNTVMMIASVPVNPPPSVAVSVIVCVPTDNVALKLLPVPITPSRLLVHTNAAPVSGPSSGSAADPMNEMSVFDGNCAPSAGEVMVAAGG